MLDSQNRKSYLHLHLLVLIWGFTAIVGLLVSVTPVILVFYRTIISAIALAILLLFRKMLFTKLKREEVIKMLLIGILLGAHWISFFAAARISTASVCLAGMATTSLWTSLIEPLVYKRPIKPLEVFLGLMAFSGLYVVFSFELDHALGLGVAVFSAILAATFTVANSKLVKKHSAMVITFYEMIGASLVSLIFGAVYYFNSPANSISIVPLLSDWPWILFLALVCTVYASTMATQLMKYFTPYLVNLTINLEPVYGITLAFLIFGEKERMTDGFYYGTLIIILAVLLYPVLSRTSWPKPKSGIMS